MPERKSLSIELKADDPGSVSAVFSTFNVIDKDGDVTLPGAFRNGAAVRLLPAHDWGHYAIGKGLIVVEPERAVFAGKFNLGTTAGKDWYESVKDLGDLQEYSYGFDVIVADFGEFQGRKVRFLRELEVHEVSPVTRGAGVGTGTLAIKSDIPFVEHAERLSADLGAFVERARSRADLLAKEGRAFSEENRERVKAIAEAMREVAQHFDALLAATEKPDDGKALLLLSAEYEAMRAVLREIGIAA